jgi:hypothetical protein
VCLLFSRLERLVETAGRAARLGRRLTYEFAAGLLALLMARTAFSSDGSRAAAHNGV